MGSAPMIALSPSGCPAAPSPSDAPPSFLRKQESIPGTRERPRPTAPLWVPASRGHDVVPPSFLRRPTVIPAELVLVETGSRNPSPPHLPPLGTRVRGHDVVPPSFLRSLSSWKRGAGIHRWDAGEAPAPSPPSGYPRTRVRRGSTRLSCGSRNPSLGRGGWPRSASPFWVPACAGTTWFHRHSCGSRNPSPPHLPPLGTRRPRARRGSTVIPAKAGIHPWGAGDGPVPPSPLWVPASAGTTTFHRHSCEACPRGNGEQESIAGRGGGPAPRPPLGVRGHSCESRNLSHAGDGPAPPPPLGTRVRGHDVVPPSFLRSLSSWKRGAGIHPPQSPKFPLQVAQNRLANR